MFLHSFTNFFFYFSHYSLLSMAPKKPPQEPSSSQELSSKKDKPKRTHSPFSYSSQEIKKRASQFSKRSFIPSRFMHELSLKSLSCYDEIKELLLRGEMFKFSFNALPSYPTLIIEFLSSFTI